MPKKPKKQDRVVENWRQNPQAIKKYSFLRPFLPQEETKSRSPLLSPKALFIYSILLAFLLVGIKVTPKYLPGVLGYASNIYVDELLKYTNQKRAEFGLSPLSMNSELSKAAEAKAKDMFSKNYWAHVSPDGIQPWDFILNAGYDYSYAGENLAKNFTTSKEVVDAWYDSPSHRENLLGENYQDIGFAVVNGVLDGYETTLVVQTFGKPRVPTYLSSSSPESLPEKPKLAQSQSQSSEKVSPKVEVPQASQAFAGANKTSEEKGVSTKSSRVSKLPFKITESINVVSTAKLVGLSFIFFLSFLLTLDAWYSKSRDIRKVSGHTMAHLAFLVFVFASIWLILSPGKIL